MPRDYKNITKNTTKKESKFSGFLTFMSGLSIGLLVAVLVYFYGNELAASFELKRPVAKQADKQIPKVSETDNEKLSPVPEPTFEFYNILPNKEVDISAWIAKQPENSDAPEQEGNYILQVGSFKQHKAADQVKARLALLGFNAYIEPGVINGEGIFRVRIGPYTNLTNLKSARERLLVNNLDFMQMRL
ncbi:MAG: cell division protein FtsN [Gammaproteobacteria bacterium]|jgi:cell division protein FtsN